MAVYEGQPVPAGSVSLVAPPAELAAAAQDSPDLTEHQKQWCSRARSDDQYLYFVVQYLGQPIGQIMLHDIDRRKREALVGYHVFQPGDRERGYGTAALGALSEYALGELGLRRLVVITARDNAASRRIAAKAGFREVGPAREGPDLVCYERLAGEAL